MFLNVLKTELFNDLMKRGACKTKHRLKRAFVILYLLLLKLLYPFNRLHFLILPGVFDKKKRSPPDRTLQRH